MRSMTLALLFGLVSIGQLARAQNALHFQRNVEDVIQLPLTGTTLAGDPAAFTVECWFNTQNTNPTEFRRVMSFGGTNTRIEVGELNGNLTYFILAGANNTGVTQLVPIAVNTWTHLAVVRNGTQFEFYLDCTLVGTTPPLPAYVFNIDYFRIGRWPGGFAFNADWDGSVDDVRLWTSTLTPTQLCARLNCPLSGNEPNLFTYWSFEDAAIAPGGNNTALTQVTDFSGNGSPGNLLNFVLTGTQSNFVSSTAPVIYPALHDLDLEVRDYPYRTGLLTGICSGDPAHFCLFDNGQTPGPYTNVMVQWEFSDDAGATWLPVANPVFTDFCFPVLPGNLTTDCTSSGSLGFVDRKYRAVSTASNAAGTIQCDYLSSEYDLQICCPVSPATLTIAPSGPFCEGEAVTFQVILNSPDPFVNTLAPNVTIDWFFNDPAVGRIPIPSAANQTSLTYPWTAPFPPGGVPGSYCFEAEIRNCQGKLFTAVECVTVDPQPVCGTIDAFPIGAPQNLTLVSTSPLVYEICPGNDAILTIDAAFLYCIPQWQYTFTDPATGTPAWTNLGLSNTTQNTNILPSHLWPAGATSIFYQIQCNPLSSPSACDPCFSNYVEVRLIDAPQLPVITGPTQVCLESLPVTLTISNPVAGLTYQWYHDGLPVGSGTSISATGAGCYWVEASNGCQTVTSAQFCLDVCETRAILSCPLTPNECACLGDPITLTACDSFNTCSGMGGLEFEWFIDGISQGPASTNCDLTHTPAATGTTYRVVVTDTITGCVDVAERTVVPCDKNP